MRSLCYFFRMARPNIEAQLAAIKEAKPTVGPTANGFMITLPHNCYAEVALTKTKQGRKANIDDLQVAEALRTNGIGARLIRVAFSHCADLGIDYVDGSIISATAMRNRGRIFGEMALHFFDDSHKEDELPITVAEASLYLDLTQVALDAATPEVRENMDPSIIARVYLNEIDTSEWERPVPTPSYSSRRS